MQRLAKRSSALLRACASSFLTLLTASIIPLWDVFHFSSFEAHVHHGLLWESLGWLPYNISIAKESDVLFSQLIDSNRWNMLLAGLAVIVSLVVGRRVYQATKPLAKNPPEDFFNLPKYPS
jgi:hypothetical protein